MGEAGSLLVRAYLRVSTEEQAEEGFSIPNQRQRVEDYCASQWGRPVEIEWYIDDGFSAKNMDRPALERLRKNIMVEDFVVVLRLDRLTRSVHDLYTLLKDWDDKGAFFRSVTEPYNTKTSEGRFMIGLLALLAQWERERIAERVREVMANITKTEGRHLNRPPFGYRQASGKLVPDPGDRKLVQEIFQRYAQGEGYRSIALDLNRRCRTPAGAQWTDRNVAYILRNPIYVGKLTFGRLIAPNGRKVSQVLVQDDQLIEGQHEPIVDETLWQAVQAEMRRRRDLSPRGATSEYPLSGVAVCEWCGGRMSGYVKKRKRTDGALGETRYYICTNRHRLESCTLPYVKADVAESNLVQKLGSLADSQTLRQIATTLSEDAGLLQVQERQRELHVEMGNLERRRRRWDEAYEAGDISRAEWNEKTGPLRSRQESIRTELEGLESHLPHPVDLEELAEHLGNVPGLWAEMTPSERKQMVHVLLDQIRVGPEGTVEITPRLWQRV